MKAMLQSSDSLNKRADKEIGSLVQDGYEVMFDSSLPSSRCVKLRHTRTSRRMTILIDFGKFKITYLKDGKVTKTDIVG